MRADIEYGVQMLRNLDDPRGPERIQAVAEKLLGQSGRTTGDGGIPGTAFDELVRRGLLDGASFFREGQASDFAHIWGCEG